MTVYAPTDVRSISIPGGCGHSHDAGDLAEGERLIVNCPPCEPGIMATRTGWAHTPEGVHLIPDEIARVEADKREADRSKNHTWGDPHALGRALAQGLAGQQASAAAGPDPEVQRQMDEMRQQIENLTALLTAAQSTRESEQEQEPGDPEEDSTELEPEPVTEAVEAPVKRPVGRPKKSTTPPVQ